MSLLDVVRGSGRLFPEPGDDDDAHKMVIFSRNGDDTITWHPDNAESVAEARREFRRLIREGFHLFQSDIIRENGVVIERRGERVTEFDPQAGKLFAVPHMRGG